MLGKEHSAEHIQVLHLEMVCGAKMQSLGLKVDGVTPSVDQVLGLFFSGIGLRALTFGLRIWGYVFWLRLWGFGFVGFGLRTLCLGSFG